MENKTNTLKIVIFDNKNVALKTIENVRLIRIKDKNYNLLVMTDYWPVLGEVDGSIYAETDESIAFEDIQGFYLISHNVFRLILKDKGD